MSFQAVPGRLSLRDVRRGVRDATSTTPGLLRARSWLIVGQAVLLAVASSIAVLGAQGTINAIGQRTAPAMIETRVIHATLADADRAAADAFLLGVGSSAPERRYEADIAAAGHELEDAAEHNGAGVAATRQLQAIIALVAEYRGLVDVARADNRELFPVGAAYLRLASSLMHSPGDGILARVDSLDVLNARGLAGEDSSLWYVAAALAASVLLMLGALAQLGWLQQLIRRRFRRRRSIPLLAARAVVLLLLCGLASQALLSYRSLATAEQQALPRLHAMWQARSLAADANGNESLSLIARGNGAAFDAAFKAETGQLAALLGTEARDAGFPGERTAALISAGAYQRFLAADAAIRARTAGGDYDGAVALALGPALRAGLLDITYADLDASLAGVIVALQRQFDRAIALASPQLIVDVAVPFMALSVAALVLLGVRPRLAEYRA